jgi:hypothetical protein
MTVHKTLPVSAICDHLISNAADKTLAIGTPQAILKKLLAAARDPLRLPDLQEWVSAFGGYHRIPPEAWAEWDKLYEESRRRRSQQRS